MSVLVLIREQQEAEALLRWGQRFALAKDCIMQVLVVKQTRQQVACHRLAVMPDENTGDQLIQRLREAYEAVRIDREQALQDGSNRDTHESELPGLWYAEDPKPSQVVVKQIEEFNASLLILGKTEHSKHDRSTDYSHQLLKLAKCDVLMLRPGTQTGKQCEQIVVPVAGGPHSIVALQLAEALAKKQHAKVSALNIQMPSQVDAKGIGEYHLKRIFKKAGVKHSDYVEGRVEVGKNVRQIINDVVSESCDLIMLGTSDHNMVSRMLFGTVDSHVMAGKSGTAVAVLRKAKPFHSRLLMAIEQFAHQQIPQLDRDERIELSERLYEGSRCGFDYLALMFLATMIASLGLMQNSTAVVVGAMLVAPLMTPIVGAGLGLVQGNAMMVRVAAKSISIGFLVAIVTGLMVGLLTPDGVINSELAGRGNPNAVDLFIALFSGVAAAYALSRPNLSAALPGVAIAAALVPPIATVGISLSLGEFTNARGAVLLFGTNVVAIIIGSAIVLHLVGIRSARSRSRVWVQRMLLGLLLTTVILAVPLSSVYVAHISMSESKSVEVIVKRELANIEHCYLHHVKFEELEDKVLVHMVILSVEHFSQEMHALLRKKIEDELSVPVELEIIRIGSELIE